MKINVDVNTTASSFGYAEAGRYRLRVVDAEVKEGKQYPYVQWRFEFADPNVKATDGVSKPGNVFEITTLKPGDNAQFRLRQVCDAIGIPWGDFDTDDVKGLEFEAELTIDEYNGKKKNVVDSYLSKE